MLNMVRHHLIHPWKARQRERAIQASAQQAAQANQGSFPATFTLPSPFARGLNERAVELTFAQLLYRKDAEVLDIGHANAKQSHLDFLARFTTRDNLTGIDLGEPIYDTTPYYKQSIRADITRHPFADNTFDTIWCISTLEHFGMDIAMYNDQYTRDAGLAGHALQAIIPALKPRGKLLLTVPFGRYENHEWFINYDAAHWSALLDVVRDRVRITEWYFKHTEKRGWHQVPSGELAYTSYHDQRNFGAAGVVVATLEKT
ncbi:MAG TPA: class I SAM-dependent methyltransferase [Kiritimatiellia bacterium]|nr:class I SAM-dependent methyltransferase [Kiritimatiellia bacterium]HMP33448.1 class I SAM-dependent methyltransferase [Kiritimatiellia bacterium]